MCEEVGYRLHNHASNLDTRSSILSYQWQKMTVLATVGYTSLNQVYLNYLLHSSIMTPFIHKETFVSRHRTHAGIRRGVGSLLLKKCRVISSSFCREDYRCALCHAQHPHVESDHIPMNNSTFCATHSRNKVEIIVFINLVIIIINALLEFILVCFMVTLNTGANQSVVE